MNLSHVFNCNLIKELAIKRQKSGLSVFSALRSIWRARRSAGFHTEGDSHHQQTVCEALIDWKEVKYSLSVFSLSPYLPKLLHLTEFLPLDCGVCVCSHPAWQHLTLCVCVPVLSGSVKCSRWTGPPSLASWCESVRVRVVWGRVLDAICSPATATAASRCGT